MTRPRPSQKVHIPSRQDRLDEVLALPLGPRPPVATLQHETWFCRNPRCREWARGGRETRVCHCGTPEYATAPTHARTHFTALPVTQHHADHPTAVLRTEDDDAFTLLTDAA